MNTDTQPTDDQSLKLFLAGCLPDKLEIYKGEARWIAFIDIDDVATKCHPISMIHVDDTELLHITWLVEQTLSGQQRVRFCMLLDPDEYYYQFVSSTWQSRAMALRKVLKV